MITQSIKLTGTFLHRSKVNNMPPKEASTDGIALSAGETKMLVAVVSLMGDVPAVSI